MNATTTAYAVPFTLADALMHTDAWKPDAHTLTATSRTADGAYVVHIVTALGVSYGMHGRRAAAVVVRRYSVDGDAGTRRVHVGTTTDAATGAVVHTYRLIGRR